MSEFLAMGGYGSYVWSSYALGFVVLLLNFTIPKSREKALFRKLKRDIEFSEESA